MPPTSRRSLWADTLPDAEHFSAAPLSSDTSVDVAIIGGGFTGLWTALHLIRRDPALRIVVLESETVGFGASGRNGGWCSSLLPMSLPTIAASHGAAAATRMQRAMHANVTAITEFAAAEGIADACHLGGTITFARTPTHVTRIKQNIATMAEFGLADAYRWLEPDEARQVGRARGALGAMHTPHCASVHPLRLTMAIARAAAREGVEICESTRVESIGPRLVVTDRGVVSAEVVVRATEGYTGQFAGERRTLLPIYSLMVATAPLGDDVWSEIGLESRPTFNDGRRLIIYGQRTADGRIAFGGRGAPYHFGSAVRPEFDTDEGVRELLGESLRDLFPALRSVEFTHHWGGVLAAPRDWTCSVRFDRVSGFATAGGYVGDGVSTTHLAGRTLAALITNSTSDEDRELTTLPWVGHRSRRWEPEPLRWLGVNGARIAAARTDQTENRTGRPSKLWGPIVTHLLGH